MTLIKTIALAAATLMGAAVAQAQGAPLSGTDTGTDSGAKSTAQRGAQTTSQNSVYHYPSGADRGTAGGAGLSSDQAYPGGPKDQPSQEPSSTYQSGAYPSGSYQSGTYQSGSDSAKSRDEVRDEVRGARSDRTLDDANGQNTLRPEGNSQSPELPR